MLKQSNVSALNNIMFYYPNIDIRNTDEARMVNEVYCGLSTRSEVFLIFTTQLYQYFSGFFFYLHC